ncbi:hypothetical protein [Solidesulfovibrio sp.]|uniref:hypothetical protein n=1 Tax=Solidesulfovibrio sp. TaxID=2910990 RepID=UPI002B215174|nr:hypothetical protein [Solidesulfovibrio sp.]MEA5090472.1 hypothetical protein [Solidesulfovibrio sp.]HML62145.1 hypothetical protein [Solidesulfovibrio sp.]
MAKNAYTFAKRAKELAKKKKKEEKQQRKSERPDAEEGPYFDEATGEIVYPEARPESEEDAAAPKANAAADDKAG